MPRILNILTDNLSLRTSLQFDEPEDSVFKTLILLLSSVSDDVEYSEKGISVQWHIFKKNLTSIAKILKSEGVDIRPDNYSKILIDDYIDDTQNFREQKQLVNISSIDLENILSKSGFKRKLTAEQLRDAHKLLLMKHGANFSVPGAGKTTTLLAVHTVLRSLGIVNCLFVISPINAFISWEDEVKAVFSDTKTIVRLKSEDFLNFYAIEQKKPDIILVNYEKMRRDINRIFSFFTRNNIQLVLDESHRIKGGASNLSFQQINKLADISKRRDILSGTPMPQSISDLDPQFDYLWSENISGNNTDYDEDDQIKSVNLRIKNLFVRTTKKELGLKDPIIKYTYVHMGAVQSELYELFRSEAARSLAGLDKQSKSYFRNIGRSVVSLLQAATNPMLLGTEDEYYQETLPIPHESKVWDLLSEFSKYEKSSKIEHLKKVVASILVRNPSNKIVIWSYFVRNVKLLERIFSSYDPVSIYGAIPSGSDAEEDNRERRIRKFHTDQSCRLMIANPQAGGEGISLHTVCHYAIYLDRNFNAAHYLQSLDRIHRLGLDKSTDTYVEILIAKDTIDELLIKRLNKKTKLMSRVLDDPGLAKLAYDPEDLIDQGLGLDIEDIKTIQNHILKLHD